MPAASPRHPRRASRRPHARSVPPAADAGSRRRADAARRRPHDRAVRRGRRRRRGRRGVAGAESVVTAPASTGFAAAIALVTPRLRRRRGVAPRAGHRARARGARPAGGCARAGSPSVAFVAPKLVRWDDRSEIVSLGVVDDAVRPHRRPRRRRARSGPARRAGGRARHGRARHPRPRRRVARARRTRSGAARAPTRDSTSGCARDCPARRVSLVPTAPWSPRRATAWPGLPVPLTPQRRRRRASTPRASRSCTVAWRTPRLLAAPLHWLSLLPLALWRSLVDLVRKQPGLIGPEWAASAVAPSGSCAVVRARRRLAQGAGAAPWAQLAPLRTSWAELRESPSTTIRRTPRRRLPPQRPAVLRRAAARGSCSRRSPSRSPRSRRCWPGPCSAGERSSRSRRRSCSCGATPRTGSARSGLDTIGPADPFAAVVAVLGSLCAVGAVARDRAALGPRPAARRARRLVRRHAGHRAIGPAAAGGAVWALAPTLLAALTQGRPAAVIAHLLLPWLFYAGSVAHRSWSGAGAASLLLAAVLAIRARRSLPRSLVLWVGAIVLAVVLRAGRGVARLVWTLDPRRSRSRAPLVWYALHARRGAWGLVADPGRAVGRPAGRPRTPRAGRSWPPASRPPTWRDGRLCCPRGRPGGCRCSAAPLALLALAAPLTQRWAAGIAHARHHGARHRDGVRRGRRLGVVRRSRSPCRCGREPGSASRGSAPSAARSSRSTPASPRASRSAGRSRRPLVCRRDRGARRAVAHVDGARRRDDRQRPGQHASGLRRRGGPRRRGRRNDRAHAAERRRGLSAQVVWGGERDPRRAGHASSSTRTEADAAGRGARRARGRSRHAPPRRTSSPSSPTGASASSCSRRPTPPESDAARTMRLSASTALDQRDTLDAVGDTAKGDALAGRRPRSRRDRRAAASVAGRRALHRDRASSRRRRSPCCSRCRPRRRAARPGAPRASSDRTGGRADERPTRLPLGDDERAAARGTVVSVVAVVAVVTAVSVPWPTVTREPVSVPATPAPAATVIACDGGAAHARPRPRGRRRDRRRDAADRHERGARKAAPPAEQRARGADLTVGRGPAGLHRPADRRPRDRRRGDRARRPSPADDIAGLRGLRMPPAAHGVVARRRLGRHRRGRHRAAGEPGHGCRRPCS